MKKPLIIAGTGNYAEVAFHFLHEEGEYEIVGFTEEASYITRKSFKGLPIYGFEEIEKQFKASEVKALVAIGPNKVNTVRARLYNQIRKKGFECITYLHPKSIVWKKEAIGENSFIFPGCIIEPYASVGNNCVMWSGSILAHHSIIHDHCFVGPGCKISGKATIKENCFLGINSTIRDNITVELKCVIGCGAVIKKNTIANGVYSARNTPLFNDQSFATKV